VLAGGPQGRDQRRGRGEHDHGHRHQDPDREGEPAAQPGPAGPALLRLAREVEPDGVRAPADRHGRGYREGVRGATAAYSMSTVRFTPMMIMVDTGMGPWASG